ncbi:MAG: A/G-specific adenine glycosylase [Actinomycetota bacterium]|nr:A/G-specific adenine glycosylase [Actinomycetota bacterium]
MLVSELMLQQTQVARVVPKYEAFMARFPTVASCANASAGDVVRLWAGLGYNRRAVNLHRAAVAMGDRVPDTLEALMALPGIGPYTARAVLAFAYERDVGVLDVNVARALARFHGRAVSQAEADGLVPAGEGWAWNQALLDLGATVCTARSPRCESCPVAASCVWRSSGGDDPFVATRQSTFEGSDRQGRGRLVDALRLGPVARSDVAATCGWPDDPDRADRIAASLVTDGLAVRSVDGSGSLGLPGPA